MAAQEGHSNVVEALLGKSLIFGTGSYNVLHCLFLGHKNINCNLGNSKGVTALTIAACNGHESVVKLLLQHPDIEPNRSNDFGWTALNLAKEGGHEEIVKLLEDRDAM